MRVFILKIHINQNSGNSNVTVYSDSIPCMSGNLSAIHLKKQEYLLILHMLLFC